MAKIEKVGRGATVTTETFDVSGAPDMIRGRGTFRPEKIVRTTSVDCTGKRVGIEIKGYRADGFPMSVVFGHMFLSELPEWARPVLDA